MLNAIIIILQFLDLIQLGRMGSGEFETIWIFVAVLVHGFVMRVNVGDEPVAEDTSVSISEVDSLDVS